MADDDGQGSEGKATRFLDSQIEQADLLNAKISVQESNISPMKEKITVNNNNFKVEIYKDISPLLGA